MRVKSYYDKKKTLRFVYTILLYLPHIFSIFHSFIFFYHLSFFSSVACIVYEGFKKNIIQNTKTENYYYES